MERVGVAIGQPHGVIPAGALHVAQGCVRLKRANVRGPNRIGPEHLLVVVPLQVQPGRQLVRQTDAMESGEAGKARFIFRSAFPRKRGQAGAIGELLQALRQ